MAASNGLKIGFVGGGKMATAMVRGMLAAGRFKAENVMASFPQREDGSQRKIEELGIRVTHDNLEIVEHNDVIFLAVRPNQVRKVTAELAPIFNPDKLMVSVALGITLRTIESLLPTKCRVIRVMPNTPTLVRAGASGFSLGTNCKDGDSETMLDILSTVGFAVEVPEKLVDPLTGLSACGPSYMFCAMEAMADGGVKMGLPRKLALKLAAHAMKGAAEMVLQTGRHPAELKDDIQSPAGSSIYAMHNLERSAFRGTLMDAVEAASVRSKETGEQIYMLHGR